MWLALTVKALQEVDRGQQDLNAQVRELKSQNELLKAELCKKDNSYGFCRWRAAAVFAG